MPSKNSLTRRTFLKVTSGAALAALGPQLAFARGVPVQCTHCAIDLEAGQLMTRSGKCRNCGADARSGNRPTPARFSKKAVRKFEGKMEMPFPHPDIQKFTAKPCGALKDVRSRKSRVRKIYRKS